MTDSRHPQGASPPCYAAPLDDQVLAARLNELVEGERAGARGLLEMRAGCEDPELAEVLDRVARDEARFCAMLGRHVERLGGVASRVTGAFYDKLLAREGRNAQLQLLDRGQSVVVRVLDELLEQPLDKDLRDDLQEMRDTHVHNIALCDRFVD